MTVRTTRAHIVIVDDEQRIRAMLTRYFEDEGFRVGAVGTARDLRDYVAAHHPDLVLLDLNLPDDDGITLARELRNGSGMGIIIVTGRADDVDRIVGLEVGADDYIIKPFNLRELLARVKSLLRRLQPVHISGGGDGGAVQVFDGWRLDRQQRRLYDPTDREVSLTTGEYDMLCALMDNAGRVLTRDFLLDQTKGRSWEAYDRTIDTQISRLRRKIEDDVDHPLRIKSVRGVGYIFTAKVAAARPG